MHNRVRGPEVCRNPLRPAGIPLFEDEPEDSARLSSRWTRRPRGVIASVRSSGEFKPKLHNTCLIHNPPGLKAERLLLVGRRQEEGVRACPHGAIWPAPRRGARKSAACKTVALAIRSEGAAGGRLPASAPKARSTATTNRTSTRPATRKAATSSVSSCSTRRADSSARRRRGHPPRDGHRRSDQLRPHPGQRAVQHPDSSRFRGEGRRLPGPRPGSTCRSWSAKRWRSWA